MRTDRREWEICKRSHSNFDKLEGSVILKETFDVIYFQDLSKINIIIIMLTVPGDTASGRIEYLLLIHFGHFGIIERKRLIVKTR